jgi:DNA (cytosine-5)-methyltransferase 1
MKPKLLDLFCKAGGAAMGYHRAGFEVTGVDIAPQPHYPFTFVQADALEYVKLHGHLYDAIHASPPCQHASKSTSIAKARGKTYPNLIPATREALAAFRVPTIIENVPGAIIRPDIICRGTMFQLGVLRKRIFEINNCFILQPGIPPKTGTVKDGDYYSIFGKGSWRKSKTEAYPKNPKNTVRESWADAMGIDWYMNESELAEAIPPAYTEYIGKQVINYLNHTL